LSIQNRAIGARFSRNYLEYLRIVSVFELTIEDNGPANGTTYGGHGVDEALLRALLSVRFLMSGVFLVNRQSVLRGGGGSLISQWRVGSLCLEGPNSPCSSGFLLRPSLHPIPIEGVG
jgi:hypothetical protein